MENISITRALAELKLLDKRISKGIKDSDFLSYEINKKNILKTFEPKEQLQSVEDLIARRALLKSKIMESNASTKVKIAGKEMLVIEAIEMKETIQYKKQLLKTLENTRLAVRTRIENINEDVKHRLDGLLQANFGKESKTKDSETEAIAKPFLERNEAKEVDLIDIDNKIKTLSDEIDTFESEVDFVLSESNSLTKISI